MSRYAFKCLSPLIDAVRRGDCQSGSAAVELALVAPVFTVLLLGIVDFGRLAYERTDMHAAVRSGAQYVMAGGADLANARSIVEMSWTDASPSSSVAVERFCECAAVEHSCNLPCDDDEPPISYIRINLTTDYQGLFLDQPVVVSEVMRVR